MERRVFDDVDSIPIIQIKEKSPDRSDEDKIGAKLLAANEKAMVSNV